MYWTSPYRDPSSGHFQSCSTWTSLYRNPYPPHLSPSLPPSRHVKTCSLGSKYVWQVGSWHATEMLSWFFRTFKISFKLLIVTHVFILVVHLSHPCSVLHSKYCTFSKHLRFHEQWRIDSRNTGKSSQLGKHGFRSLHNLTWTCYYYGDILLRH